MQFSNFDISGEILGCGWESQAIMAGQNSVIKKPLHYISESMQKDWMQRQVSGSFIFTSLQKMYNIHYRVATMLDLDSEKCHTLETFAPGKELTSDRFKTFSHATQSKVIRGFCEFCNDMHQSGPIRYGIENYIPNNHVLETDEFLTVYHKEYTWLIDEIICGLSRLPNYNTSYVFGIYDINPGNIRFDENNPTPCFIDFAGSVGKNYINNDVHKVLFGKFAYYCGITDRVREVYMSLRQRKPVVLDDGYNIFAGHISDQIDILGQLIYLHNMAHTEQNHSALSVYKDLIKTRLDRIKNLWLINGYKMIA